MSKQKRLHPIAVGASFLKQLKDMIFPLLAVTIFGGRGTDWGLFSFFTPIAFVTLTFIFGVLNWLRFTYRIEENELRIESGIIVRKKRYIPFERIQSLDLTEGILHRAFGLVKLNVETAGGSGKQEAEAVLAAISKEEANKIQAIFSASKDADTWSEGEILQEQAMIYKMTQTDLFILAVTSGGTGVILSAAFAFLMQFDEIIPYKLVYRQFENLVDNGILFVTMLLAMGLFAVWLMALVGTLFKYGNFTVMKTKDDLIITRGLLEKRQITVPLKRIQAIRITQNPIRQLIGYASVYVENAGGSLENGELAKVILLPVVKNGEIKRILGDCLLDYHFDVKIHPAPKRALIRYLMKGWLFILPIVIIPVFFLKPWVWVSFFAILTVTYIQYLAYRDAGWGIEGNQLALQYRRLTKNIVFMEKGKIQSANIEQSFFQRKKELSTIQALIKSGQGGTGGRVVDLELNDAAYIYQWFSYNKQ